MSAMERATALLKQVPAYRLEDAIAYLQGLVAEEEADDAFCEELYQRYRNDPERGDFVSLDEAVEALGVSPDALRDSN